MSTLTQNPGDASIAELVELLEPFVDPLIERIDADEFTTVQFVEAMQLDDETRAAYDAAVAGWREDNPELAKMVVHGQVIPQLLRGSALVEWAGFAYGELDPYAVPAWWRKRGSSAS